MRQLFAISVICVISLALVTPATPQVNSGLNPQIVKIVSEISAANIEATIRKLVTFKTRHTLSDTESPTEGIGAARNWIKSEMDRYSKESGGRLKVEFQESMAEKSARIPTAVKIVNVVATLPGTQAESKDRIYLVSGHYDSRASMANDATSAAPGANDDGSGTAAVMEMARVMSKYEFDATLVFVTVAGEEQGLNGSTALALKAKAENWNIGAMFDNDIIGNTTGGSGIKDNTRIRVFSEGVPTSETPQEAATRQRNGGENDGPSRQLARYIKDIGERYVSGFEVTLVARADRYGRGGDHEPFLKQGYAAVRFTEPNEDFHHQHQNVRVENGIQYGDLPEFVDYAYCAQVARVNASALASLALAPAAPTKVNFTGGQEYDTVLSWEANKEPDVAGYQVLVRTTIAPMWEKRIYVGNVTTAKLIGLSKDDYMFAVQAIDKDGNPSIASFPHPLPRRPAGTQPQQSPPAQRQPPPDGAR